MGEENITTKSQKLIYNLIQLSEGVDDKVVLAKLQYFVDFIHFAFYEKPVSDADIIYTRQKMGPLARSLTTDLKQLKKTGFIKEVGQYKYEVTKEMKEKLEKNEIKTIKFVLAKYGQASWRDLKRICHEQAPYLSTTEGAVVEFFTAFNLIDEYPDYKTFSFSMS